MNEFFEGTVDTSEAYDDQPYMILSYANGYGYYEHLHAEPFNDTDASLERLDLTDLEQNYTNYRFISPAAVPMKAGSETHSGADVGIFASGRF